MQGCEKCDLHSHTQRKNSLRNLHSNSRTLSIRDIERVMIFLNPYAGKIKRIMRSDWLPEHLAASGNPALVTQDKVLVFGLVLFCVLLTST